jgi:hypothetical protein
MMDLPEAVAGLGDQHTLGQSLERLTLVTQAVNGQHLASLEVGMNKLELSETIEALRAELGAAIAEGADQPIQFPVGAVQLEFQLGVTKDASARGGVRFYIFELGADAGYSRETVQKLTLTLEAPVDQDGQPIKVSRRTRGKP